MMAHFLAGFVLALWFIAAVVLIFLLIGQCRWMTRRRK